MKNDQRQANGKYSPLRYPGGKGKLARFVKVVVAKSGLLDGVYVEPFAGGAAVALELLLEGYVSRIEINDKSRSVFSFWYSVLNDTDELCRKITNTPLSVEEWDRQKAVQRASDPSLIDLGFSTFYLNRTNRSGILNAGVIGGRAQEGGWLMDARYNATDLRARVERIAKFKDSIFLSNIDAVDLIKARMPSWGLKTLIYLDPPYYIKGKHLYYHFYDHNDHVLIRDAVKGIKLARWMVSYDDVPEIRDLYPDERFLTYQIGYSARSASTGQEVMFFSRDIKVPQVEGSMVEVSRSADYESDLLDA